jgi:hypothetical protein
MVRPVVLAGLVVLFPAIVEGQGRAAMPAAAASHMMAAAPRAVAPHPVSPVAAQPVMGARIVPRNGAVRGGIRPSTRTTRMNVGERRHFDIDDRMRSSACKSGAPGLGFDEVHLAAVCGPDGVGMGRFGQGAPFFFPFFDGGFYMPSVPVEEEAAVTDAQQQEAGEVDAREARRRVKDSQPAPALVAEPDHTPIREAEQYVFVRRDGTLFFAVAYAWENGTLRYVTTEGLRRNIAQNALDLEATQQFNEQRGLNFRLPA